MGLALTATLGVCLMIVLWAVGEKAIDAAILTVVIVLVAAMWRMVAPALPGNRRH